MEANVDAGAGAGERTGTNANDESCKREHSHIHTQTHPLTHTHTHPPIDASTHIHAHAVIVDSVRFAAFAAVSPVAPGAAIDNSQSGIMQLRDCQCTSSLRYGCIAIGSAVIDCRLSFCPQSHSRY